MKRILSFKHLLCFFIAVASFSQSEAQTTITTNFTTPTTYIRNVTTPNPYVSFSVTNNNANYPITVTDIGKFHAGDVAGNSENGAKYTLWYSTSNTVGSPIPIIPANGWNLGPTTNNIINGTTNAILPIFTGLSITIPPSSSARFIVSSSLTQIFARSGASPTTFNNSGVVLETTTDQYFGKIPDQAFNALQSYEGFVTFIRAAPEAPIVSADDNQLCVGDSLVLNAIPPSYVANPTITWYDPANNQIGTGARLVLYNVTAAQAGQYKATVADDVNVSPSGITNITITDPVLPIIQGRTAYCINDQFEPLSVIGANIKWYNFPTGGVGTNIPPYINTSVAGSFTFFASQTVNGCESARVPVTLTSAPKPTAPTVTPLVGFCELEPAPELTAGGQNLKWYTDPASTIGSVIPPVPNTSKPDTFTYYVSQTVDGCEGPRSQIDVVITFKPNGLIVASKEELCQNDTLTLGYYGSGNENTAYQWTLPEGASLISGSGAGPLVIRLDTPGNYKFQLQASNFQCFSDIYKQNILVDRIPTAVIAADERFCMNASKLIFLYSYTPTVDTFMWDFGGGEVSHFAQDQGPFGVTFTSSGEKIVSLTIADEKCRATVTDTITVLPLPDAGFDIEGLNDGSTVCTGDSLRFSAKTIEPVSKYEWSPVRFFDIYVNDPVTFGRVDYATKIKLKVTDEYGCVNADSVMINTKPCCEVQLPTAFTPNNDGLNDIYRIITPGNHSLKTFRIMNRWGQIVFETVDEKRGWNGTFNGTPLDLGTYFYYVAYKCEGKPAEQKGELTLIR